jgi:hypothetical protein
MADVFFSAEELQRGILDPAQASGLKLIEDIDYRVSPKTLLVALNGERPECHSLYPHLMLCNRFGSSRWHCYTSVVVTQPRATAILQEDGSGSQGPSRADPDPAFTL